MNFKSFLSLSLLIVSLTVLSAGNLCGQNKNNLVPQNLTKESGLEMIEIKPEKLPEEIKKDIIENFHNAEIVKAFKVWKPGAKRHEYWVDVKQGPKKWSLQFDADGNAINKINPVE